MKKIISTTKAPAAIGPYSQAIEKGGMLFVSGQIPLDPATGKLVGEKDIKKQTTRVLESLKHILEEAGYSLNDVVKTTCYLREMIDFPEMNEVYATYFGDSPPARATVEVNRLPLDVMVEIDAMAVKE